MEIALVGGERSPPSPGLKGFCPMCEQAVLAKCGPTVRWHWSHKGKRHCDTWWENETDWHRAWKGQFPEHMHEVIHFDETSGEKHVADLKTDRGMVIEIQHSAMSLDELRSREAFYKHMIWIVDGSQFAKQFAVHKEPLPHPQSSLLDDVVFFPNCGRMFWRRSENEPSPSMVLVHKSEEIAESIHQDYRGHHFFTWTRPREVWLQASAPVFIDFGGDELFHICSYASPPERCVKRVSKRALIEKNGGTYKPFGASLPEANES